MQHGIYSRLISISQSTSALKNSKAFLRTSDSCGNSTDTGDTEMAKAAAKKAPAKKAAKKPAKKMAKKK